MKFSVKPTDPKSLKADVVVIFTTEDSFLEDVMILGSQMAKVVKKAAEYECFFAKQKESLFLSTEGKIAAYKLLIAGAGKKDSLDLLKIRRIVAKNLNKAKEANPKTVAFRFPSSWYKIFGSTKLTRSAVEAVNLSSYGFEKYKGKKKERKSKPREVIINTSAGKIKSAEQGVNLGELTSQATILARNLVNEPAEETSPEHLAQIALSIEKKSKKKVKVKIFEEKDIVKLGMNAYLGVSKGSAKPPKFIRLEYKPKVVGRKIVLVGKGITFDTGGLSLKSSKGMELMKMDMAGSAAVLSVFSVLYKLSVEHHVVGLIAACENMPSSKALKPGDILKSANGKTIEVLNTDAEGRLTLADVLSYASSYEKPEIIIDMATLTGACMVALGIEIAGLWSNDKKLISKIEESAKATGEKVWHMPLEKDYEKLIESDIADVRNVEKGRYGGAITAALFLGHFVEDKISWAHLDIAGPAFYQKDAVLIPKGASGFGARLLLQFLLDL